ncbi:hypothetical protein ANO11243_076870 [Dothideomycetidae sp. 11243]|nr:hypothetical protein ANO11243_076870 [fungal sp. No.11243]
MPGLIQGRKRSLLPDESESDGDSASQDETPSANKRARLNGHVCYKIVPEGSVLPASYRSDPSMMPGANGRSSTALSHQPGSIVRVALKDFVTYTRAEFHLGPSLNMVIGPNGTGKSTLVCAICLGLGWKTEHLGRAKDIGEFVKHGAAEAEIEIELGADPARHKSNPVIRLNIKKSNSSTKFFLNGRAVSRKQVLDECKAFSIQIDNLCQFLPQDRVVEFAALSPVDLLTQTQRAAAPPEMTIMHDELKGLHVEKKQKSNDHASVSEGLKNLEARQTLQRTDVQRLQQRVQLQEEIEALELYRPIVQYNEVRKKFDELKVKKQAASQEYNQLELEVEPALRAVNTKQDYCNDIDAAVQQRRRLIKRSEEHSESLLQKQTDISDKIATANREIDTENTREKTLKQERARIDLKIKAIEVNMNEGRPEFDAAAYNEKLRAFTRDMRDLEERGRQSNAEQDNCDQQIMQRKARISGLTKELEDLKSQAGQQQGKLKRASMETYKAWQWIEQHRDMFQGPVLGPPIISCSVRDPQDAVFVESVMNNNEMLAITVTNEADFRLLSDKLTGELRYADVYIRSSKIELSRYRAPLSREQLADMGLDCYILDLLQGPDQVLGMLCDNRNIHQTAVARRNLSPEQYTAVTQSNISSFVTPSEIYTITRRREYGDRGASTRTRKVRPAQVFTNQQADTGAEREISDQKRELNGEIQELEDAIKGHKETSARLKIRFKELSDEQKDLQEEKNQKQKALSNYNALPMQLQNAKEKLEEVNTRITASLESRQALSKQIGEDVMQKGQDALLFAASVQTLQKTHTDLLEAELQLIEAQSDLETLELRNTEVRQLLEQSLGELDRLRAAQNQARNEARALLVQVNTMTANLSETAAEIHARQPTDMTFTDLESVILGLQARLDLVHEGNPNVMREYEERGLKIQRGQERLDRLTNELQALDQKIQEIRTIWEPQLDALIEKISDAFGDNMARINCAGHVEVAKPEDFADWAIWIKVKFRENEQLSVLDSHRQSGGERAVSTIFYLMALQSLARAPFRVVDEINQGMDPRNERLVHSRMVSIACEENTSQYFLITPKLLPNLEYHPNMKIQCIASGEYLPDDHKKLNFQTLAEQAISIQRRRTGLA